MMMMKTTTMMIDDNDDDCDYDYNSVLSITYILQDVYWFC